MDALIDPMLARLTEAVSLPDRVSGGLMYEPKWDGFRGIVYFDGSDVEIGSRGSKLLTRYFPELVELFRDQLAAPCILDGETVVRSGRPGAERLDWELLSQRIHPAASRVAKLAQETPASFVAFDLLSLDGVSLLDAPFGERRAALEKLLARVQPPVHVTPVTRDRDVAQEWLTRFEGAGLDGVIAKPASGAYLPGKRAMLKIKHARTAECVVAGFRWHKSGRDAVGSLLLGLFDDTGTLQHVGVTSSFTMVMRKALVKELEPLRRNALDAHPWREWGGAAAAASRMPGAQSRWSAGKDLSWEPLRIERVCEVKYDHMQGDRFRHGAVFLRWRPDKQPRDCRYDQLEVTRPYELARIFSSGSSGS